MNINRLMKYGALIICFSIASSIVGCASNKQRIPTDEEIAAALEKEKIAKQKSVVEQEALKKQQGIQAKAKLDEMMKVKAINIKKLNTELYFGDEFKTYKKSEFETTTDYTNRLKSQLDPNKVFYFEVDAILSYDADKQYYKLYAPSPFPKYSGPKYRYDSSIDPALQSKDKDNDHEGAFMRIQVSEDKSMSTYAGKNAYGAKAQVVKMEVTEYVFAAFYNSFSGMYNYGNDLVYRDVKFSADSIGAFPNILMIVPLKEAKAYKLQKRDVIARIGVKFTYGVGPIALTKDFDIKTPTVSDPTEFRKETRILGVDLDSVCLLTRQSRDILACRMQY